MVGLGFDALDRLNLLPFLLHELVDLLRVLVNRVVVLLAMSTMIVLGTGDRIAAITDTHSESARTVATTLLNGQFSNSRDALTTVLAALEPVGAGDEPSDVSAVLITRTTTSR